MSLGWKEGKEAESKLTSSIRNQRTAVVKGHSRAPPPSLAERELVCDEECVQMHPDLIQRASSQLLLWQRHCRGFGSSEDLSACWEIGAGGNGVLRSALDCNSLKTGRKWGRGEGLRRWLQERFEFRSDGGILGSARSIRNLFHPWTLSSSGGLAAQTWTEAERMLLPERGSVWGAYPLLLTPVPFMPCCGLGHRRRAQLPYVSVWAPR